MVIMATLTMDPTSLQHSLNQLTIDKSSFILKESTDANSSICCCDNEGYHSLNVLCAIPTSIFHETKANAITDLLNDDDDDNNPHKNEQEDFSTFLQEWDGFCKEFVNLTTCALTHSSADSLMPSPIVDDDDDNGSMSKGSNQPMTTNSFDDDSLQ